MTKKDTVAPTWKVRLGRLIGVIAKRNETEATYARANRDSVRRALQGLGPNSPKLDASAGARMVVNISSAHVPGFCNAAKTSDPKPYKNCYDLALVGLGNISRDRRTVDDALPLPATLAKEDVYFGAVELNGSGIRFYGDICLVLKRDAVEGATVLLDRNSYDLLRSPIKEEIANEPAVDRAAARRRIAEGWRGEWGMDLGDIAAVRALLSTGSRNRRWTIGQISEAVRDDEDYIEVLRNRSFGTRDLQEARVSSGDAAHDALIGSRLRHRPLPRLESLIWRNRRSRAEAALRAAGVPVRIVTTTGRTRG